jgi:hypothetical protein
MLLKDEQKKGSAGTGDGDRDVGRVEMTRIVYREFLLLLYKQSTVPT